MQEWQSEKWPRRHVIAAPFGILAATALLVGLAENWQWSYPAVVRTAGALVDLGVVVYTALAVLVELGYWAMFYAMEKTNSLLKREREKGREEGREEGRAEERENARAEREALLEYLRREKGITPDDLPSP